MSQTVNLEHSRGNQRFVPEAYRVTSIVLENHFGQTYDLASLQTDFSITESIYHTGLIFSINIKDSINFFEIGQLTGQETITVNLTQGVGPEPDVEPGNTQPVASTSKEQPKTISKMFFVTEYPLYGKTENRVEVYTIKGVSQHVYLSKLKKVSEAFTGTIADFIKKILTKYLGVGENSIIQSKQASPLVSFIVPNLNPIDAIQWALRRCYDDKGSPWYCYETLDGKIHIESHMDISERAKEKTIREYSDGHFFQHPIGSSKDFEQKRSRILNLASNIGISKYLSGINGAYASKSVYVNISSKKIETLDFNYSNQFKNMAKVGEFSPLSRKFTPENRKAINVDSRSTEGGRSTSVSDDEKIDISVFDQKEYGGGGISAALSSFSDSHINYISLNGKSFAEHKNYHSATENKLINIANSVNENMQFMSHDFTIAGDLDFHSGKIVKLLLRSTFKPTNEPGKMDQAENQKMFSGYYLVTSVAHRFEKQYYCDVRVNTDAYSANIFSTNLFPATF